MGHQLIERRIFVEALAVLLLAESIVVDRLGNLSVLNGEPRDEFCLVAGPADLNTLPRLQVRTAPRTPGAPAAA